MTRLFKSSRFSLLSRARIVAFLCFGVASSLGVASAGTPKKYTLDELFELAKSHAIVDASRARSELFQAKKDEAKSAAYPKFKVSAFLGPSPDVDCENPECSVTAQRNATLDLDGVFGGFQLDAAQPLYTFGKISAISRAAEVAAKAASLGVQTAEADLSLRLVEAYYGLKLARELKGMLEEGEGHLKKATALLEKQLKSGKGNTIQDKFRLESFRAEIESRLSNVLEAETSARAGIQAFTQNNQADIDNGPLERGRYQKQKDLDDTVSQAMAQNPRLRAGRMQAEAARAFASYEKRQWLPNILLLARFNIARAQGVDDPPSAFANDPFNVTSVAAGLFVKWDIDPMAQMAKVKQANAQARQALALVEAGSAALALETNAAMAKVTGAAARITSAEKGVKSAKAWVASVLQGEAIGVVEPKDLADAYLAYFTVKSRLLEALFDWHLANHKLRVLLGKSAGKS